MSKSLRERNSNMWREIQEMQATGQRYWWRLSSPYGPEDPWTSSEVVTPDAASPGWRKAPEMRLLVISDEEHSQEHRLGSFNCMDDTEVEDGLHQICGVMCCPAGMIDHGCLCCPLSNVTELKKMLNHIWEHGYEGVTETQT